MRKIAVIIIIPLICVPVLFSIVVSWISGNIILDYGRYFAVDETGRVYLSVGYDIHVYQGSMLVNKFLVGRGIRFTIQNDEISAYDGSYTSRYTLDGKKISSEKGGQSRLYTQYRYFAEDGTQYAIRYPFGRFSILDKSTDTYIYQMPLRDFVSCVVAIASMCILAAWCCFLALCTIGEIK
jgi:hypothetical protein